jgi:hypothetical protein
MILALWAVPRSVSTAFERSMRQRGDLIVFFGPFSDYYYYSTERASKRYLHLSPQQDCTALHTLSKLQDAARIGRVFIKDMAYYLRDCMCQSFVANFTNTFLIRHPRYALPSHYRLQPNFTLEEAGYHQQHRLMMLVEAAGQTPLVIDGETLRTQPSRVLRHYCEGIGLPYMDRALTWHPGLHPAWSHSRRWVVDAAQSSSFLARTNKDLQPLAIPRVREMYEQCYPLYEDMRCRITA